MSCKNCGSEKDPSFSRVEPMGYYCQDCGYSDECVTADERIKLLESGLAYCKSWFEKHSPTAPCIDGVDRPHPMIELIDNALSGRGASKGADR